MFVLSTVVSFALAKTVEQASSKYLLCESMCVCVCVWGGAVEWIILEKKKEELIPLLIVTHFFQATLGLFSFKTFMNKVQFQSSWRC